MLLDARAVSWRVEANTLDLDRLRGDLVKLSAECSRLGVPNVQSHRALMALSAVEALSEALRDREG